MSVATVRASRALLISLLAAFVLVVAPATSSAIYPAPGYTTSPGLIVRPDATYKGFAYMRGLGICPPNVQCFWAGELNVPVWDWTGTAWKQAYIKTGTQVYVYPFSGEWRWVYDYGTSRWYAATASRIVLRTNNCWDYANWRYSCMHIMAAGA